MKRSYLRKIYHIIGSKRYLYSQKPGILLIYITQKVCITNLQEQLDILEKYDGKQLYLDNPKTFEFLINMMKLKINGRINPYILEEIKNKFKGWFRLLTNLNGIYYSTTWYKFYEIYTELNREQNYTISFYDGHLYTWIKKLKEEKESDKMTIHCDLLLSSVNDNWINDIL